MGITDMIAGFIQEALDDAGGVLEMQRGDLAQRFGCVPSQINYVMSTRFSPEHGYIVESRRGGGGYIRITRVHVDRQTLMMHVINSIGSENRSSQCQSHPLQSGAVGGHPRPDRKAAGEPFVGHRSAIRSQGSAQRPAGRPAEAGPHPSGIASDRYS